MRYQETPESIEIQNSKFLQNSKYSGRDVAPRAPSFEANFWVQGYSQHRVCR